MLTSQMTGKSGVAELYDELFKSSFVQGPMAVGQLRTTPPPFNVFAMVGQGKIPETKPDEKAGWLGGPEENAKLGDEFSRSFKVACNLPVNDYNWDKDTP